MKIGRYQLENLLRNRIGFLYLDLREEDQRSNDKVDASLLQGSEVAESLKVVEELRGRNLPRQTPIVLICENGAKSLALAEALEEDSFMNVFVVDGGVEALEG